MAPSRTERAAGQMTGGTESGHWTNMGSSSPDDDGADVMMIQEVPGAGTAPANTNVLIVTAGRL